MPLLSGVAPIDPLDEQIFAADTPVLALSVYDSLTPEQQLMQLRPMSVQTRPNGPWKVPHPGPRDRRRSAEPLEPEQRRRGEREDASAGSPQADVPWARFGRVQSTEEPSPLPSRPTSRDVQVRLLVGVLIAIIITLLVVRLAPQWFGMQHEGPPGPSVPPGGQMVDPGEFTAADAH